MYKSLYFANIYISTSALGWEDKNIYIANEISRLKPVFNKMILTKILLVKSLGFKVLINFKIKNLLILKLKSL